MPAQLLDGKALAANIRSELKKEIQRLGTTPGLAVILIGDDPASHTYVRLKERAAKEIGIRFEKILFPKNIDEELVLVKIDELNRRDDMHGILVQLPLPKSLHTDRIIFAIRPEKDADGFHPVNIKKFLNGDPTVTPVTTQAIDALLSATHVPLSGKHALILANSSVFAKPVKKMLANHGVHADIITKLTTDNLQLTTYDILITARGIPGSVTPMMVKEGAIVIDVGTTRVDDTIRGDVDPAVTEKAGWLSPVPGGVGPLTVAFLLKNVVESVRRITGESS
ncbi:bifunctional methylenetetrahydrofolate dehydrogenase/methenyltetrahydrofolate cyclohydrolase [Candidatus Uhrbacteria bacterium]|nr:bifunctional methylenetetrahydrofolate dehydrogenase/methenyltetrahydrofolate cyclohydrolase [Candidatus Uhrbacteria bacterium]